MSNREPFVDDKIDGTCACMACQVPRFFRVIASKAHRKFKWNAGQIVTGLFELAISEATAQGCSEDVIIEGFCRILSIYFPQSVTDEKKENN